MAINKLVMPGDNITDDIKLPTKTSKIILGPGLRRIGDHVTVCKAGILKQSTNLTTFWVDSYQTRYIASKGDTIIGVVIQKAGDIFRVDIGASEPAAISYLAFESATKKNRPDVNVGDLLFAKLLVAHKDFESELVCVDSLGKKMKLGQLNGGFVFNCSITLARKLRSPTCPLLEAIKKHIQVPVEIVVGMNGRVWIHAKNERDIIAVGNAILAAENKSNDEIEQMCDQIGTIFTGIH